MRRGFLRECLGLAAALAVAWPAGAAEVAQVQIRDNLFQPATLTVKAGTTVRWINNEKRTTHSVLFTGEGGGFESERMFPDESYERRFDKPGRYPYTCGPHPEMKGVVIVE
jgi:plastocyanin